MKKPWRSRIAAAALALVVGAAPILVGWQAPAAAARPCQQVFGVTKPAPPRDQLPGVADGLETPTGSDAFYDYPNEAELLRNIGQPTPPELVEAGSDSSKWPVGSKNHAVATWRAYLERKAQEGKAPLAWDRWLRQYIPNQGNAARGFAYEGFGANRIGLSGPDWSCQAEIPGSGENRIYDAVNEKQKVAYEFKSGSGIDSAQLEKDKRIAARTGYRIIYVFGQEPSKAAVRKLTEAGIGYHKMKATGRSVTVGPPAQGPQTGVLSPSPDKPSRGALPEYLGRAGRTPAEAREIADVDEELAQKSGRPDQRLRRPGGVDFTTMELRYVQDTGDGAGLEYAFNTEDLPDEEVSAGGLEVAQLSSDAFFTWLALPASAFWVNLNPGEPDRIIDPKLGSTDAGRVLLEADLTMKKVAVNFTNPSSALGAQFWDSLRQGPAQPLIPCFAVRNWIVPGPATVRENGGQLYILEAPLKVMSAPIGEELPPGTSFDACRDDPPDIIEHNQRMWTSLIQPKVEEAVNTSAQFEDLRRVYLSRVAAEWIRQRSSGRTTAFSGIIGSEDVSKWPSRVPWDPREVFQRYLKSVNEGEYSTEHTFHQTGSPVTVMVSLGGVDFSSSPRDNLNPAQFEQKAPSLPVTIAAAQFADRQDIDGLHTWFGGQAAPPPAPSGGGGGGSMPVTGGSTGLLVGAGVLLLCGGVLLFVLSRRKRYPDPIV
ncbi:MAG TPA: hypothetical protein VF062_18440 [Candidatus Limnocylindrales bacterium]